MYLIPLSQLESVELVIHALRAAGGAADCSACPVRKVCTRQCLAVADGIERLLATDSLPSLAPAPAAAATEPPREPEPGGGRPSLRIVK
jgi:hypothetical protein